MQAGVLVGQCDGYGLSPRGTIPRGCRASPPEPSQPRPPSRGGRAGTAAPSRTARCRRESERN
eukprot:scaffold4907_cov122-Isochrysis_galbana.AAC.1